MNLSDFEDLFERHICFYFDCDLCTMTGMDGHWARTLVSELARIDGDNGQGRTCTGMANNEIEFWLGIFWF
jgi:hypothetical protein